MFMNVTQDLSFHLYLRKLVFTVTAERSSTDDDIIQHFSSFIVTLSEHSPAILPFGTGSHFFIDLTIRLILFFPDSKCNP